MLKATGFTYSAGKFLIVAGANYEIIPTIAGLVDFIRVARKVLNSSGPVTELTRPLDPSGRVVCFFTVGFNVPVGLVEVGFHSVATQRISVFLSRQELEDIITQVAS